MPNCSPGFAAKTFTSWRRRRRSRRRRPPSTRRRPSRCQRSDGNVFFGDESKRLKSITRYGNVLGFIFLSFVSVSGNLVVKGITFLLPPCLVDSKSFRIKYFVSTYSFDDVVVVVVVELEKY